MAGVATPSRSRSKKVCGPRHAMLGRLAMSRFAQLKALETWPKKDGQGTPVEREREKERERERELEGGGGFS